MLIMEKLLTDLECKELNKFGKLELTASHIYLQLANRMRTLSYFGAEKFFLEESKGERKHYKEIGEFMNKLNCEISVETINPTECGCQDIKSALEMAYEMEKDLMLAYESAAKNADISLKVALFLQDFAAHQVDSVGEFSDLLARLALTDNMLLFDQELGK